MITIDGSQGEGGGQIVRTALSLSAATGRPVRLVKMRANRRPPGLRPQHLAAVRAAAEICAARVGRLEPGLSELTFEPGQVRPGRYAWDIGTAGSSCLVLQTVAMPLALADAPSHVEISGGTHNPRAPCFEYLAAVWVPMLGQIGIQIRVELSSAGFYPKGGGKIIADIAGRADPARLRPLALHQRGRLMRIEGVSAVANLPLQIAERQRSSALEQLKRCGLQGKIDVRTLPSAGMGTVCFLEARFERVLAGFFGLGAPGKRAEVVGQEAGRAMARFCTHASGAPVDPHLADQLIVPLALAEGASSYRTTQLTEHTRTNASVTRQMLGRAIELDGEPGQAGTVNIERWHCRQGGPSVR